MDAPCPGSAQLFDVTRPMLTPPDMVRFFGLAVTVKSAPFQCSVWLPYVSDSVT